LSKGKKDYEIAILKWLKIRVIPVFVKKTHVTTNANTNSSNPQHKSARMVITISNSSINFL